MWGKMNLDRGCMVLNKFKQVAKSSNTKSSKRPCVAACMLPR